jgi:hypothetical protein
MAQTKREFDKATKRNAHGRMEAWYRADYRTARFLPHCGASCERSANLAGWTFDAIEWRAAHPPLYGVPMLCRASKWRNIAAYARDSKRPMLRRSAPCNHPFGYADSWARYTASADANSSNTMPRFAMFPVSQP